MSNWKENQDLAGYEFTQNIIFVSVTSSTLPADPRVMSGE
jgi:hypothetical protein